MTQSKYYANKRTHVIHARLKRDACFQGQLKPFNVVKFNSLEAAISAGMKCCKRCRFE